ncbi:MAG: hypothetical protein QOC74_3498, partial [Pseudonocardiales bacterium]|nr:hypothetical protein [Pseudonocardiales bacterium]
PVVIRDVCPVRPQLGSDVPSHGTTPSVAPTHRHIEHYQ